MNLADIFQWVNDELEWGEYQPPTDRNDPRTMKDLWNDLVGIIPYSDYLAWFLEQYAINPDMQTLIARQEYQYSEIFHIKEFNLGSNQKAVKTSETIFTPARHTSTIGAGLLGRILI